MRPALVFGHAPECTETNVYEVNCSGCSTRPNGGMRAHTCVACPRRSTMQVPYNFRPLMLGEGR